MMNEQDNENGQGFKVVDRRRVDEEGHLRETESAKRVEEPKATSASEKADTTRPVAEQGITFSLFAQSLAHQAMMALGMVPWSDTGLIKPDLKVAKEMIDILLLMKQKTTGNLDASEQALIDTLTYQLQMAFVEINQSPLMPNK